MINIPSWLCRVSFASLMAVFLAISAYIYYAPVLAADEIAFFVWADRLLAESVDQGFFSFLTRENCSGYGSMYWTVYINSIVLFGSLAPWVMRTIALVAYVSIPLRLAYTGSSIRGEAEDARYGWLLAALWLSMPLAWWCGKISGPDTIAVAFAMHGLLAVIRSNTDESAQPCSRDSRRFNVIPASACGWLLLGISLALKLTMLPAVLFAVMYMHLDQGWWRAPLRAKLKATTAMAAFGALGFIVCNPVALFAPATFYAELQAFDRGTAWNWPVAKLALSNQVWTWDGVFAGGLAQWAMVPLAMGLLAGLALCFQWRAFLACLSAFMVTWYLITSKNALLGWYWFGWITTFVATAYCLIENAQFRSKRVADGIVMAVSLAVGFNFLMQAPSVVERLRMKHWHVAAQAELPQLSQRLFDDLDLATYDVVIDYGEVTHVHGLDLSGLETPRLVQTSPPSVTRLSPNWTSWNEDKKSTLLKRAERGILSDAFVELHQLGSEGSQGRRMLVIVSSRLTSKHVFADFPKFLNQRVIPGSPPGTEFEIIAQTPSITAFDVHTPSPQRVAGTSATPPTAK